MGVIKPRVYYYHADASPIGGHITHPYHAVLPNHGSISLAQAGGFAANRAVKPDIDDLIRVETAHSHVSGAPQPGTGNFATLVTSVIEGLNVFDVVTADRIVSRLAIEHPYHGGYPKVSFIGSSYDNLKVGGQSITPAINLNLLSAPPPRGQDGCEGNQHPDSGGKRPDMIEFPDRPWPLVASFVDRAVDQTLRITRSDAPEALKGRYTWMESAEDRKRKGFVVCSLVDSVQGPTPGSAYAAPGSAYGHVLDVPYFGRVFLGELIVDPVAFRLTMLRIEMGSLAEGDLSFATSNGNGCPMP